MKNFFNAIINSFKYSPQNNYHFNLSNSQNNTNNKIVPLEDLNENVYPSIDVNLEYIKSKFNSSINSDIKIRQFDLIARNKMYKAFVFYEDKIKNYEFFLYPNYHKMYILLG